MRSVKVMTAAAALTAAADGARARLPRPVMQLGNYDVLTNRYTQASWVWFVSACHTPRSHRTAWTSARYRD